VSDRRRFTLGALVAVTLAAGGIGFAIAWLLPLPWSLLTGCMIGATLGWWAGRYVLHPLLRVGFGNDESRPHRRVFGDAGDDGNRGEP
jgi:hypothetical protein